MKKIIISFLLSISMYCTYAQHTFVPLKHSNRWSDGAEWAIETKEGLTVRTLVSKVSSRFITFEFYLKNHRDTAINIIPKKFYYTTTNEIKDIRTRSVGRQRPKTTNQHLEKCLHMKPKTQKQLMDKVALLAQAGVFYDINHANSEWLESGHYKDKYLKEVMLLNNTIEPQQEIKKLVVFDKCMYAETIAIHFIIENTEMQFDFKKMKLSQLDEAD